MHGRYRKAGEGGRGNTALIGGPIGRRGESILEGKRERIVSKGHEL